MHKYAHLVDLEKCCKMNIHSPKSVSIQLRTSPPKFGKNSKLPRFCNIRQSSLRKCIFSRTVRRPRKPPRSRRTRAHTQARWIRRTSSSSTGRTWRNGACTPRALRLAARDALCTWLRKYYSSTPYNYKIGNKFFANFWQMLTILITYLSNFMKCVDSAELI